MINSGEKIVPGEDAVAIIPCTNQKSDIPGPAREVWIGAHFQLVLAHAEIFYDRIYVMSYKYGLITPEYHIEPYDIDIRTANAGDKLRWWAKMKGHIAELARTEPLLVSLYTGSVERERIIREFIKNDVKQILVPFDGATVGRRMEMVYDLEPPFDREKAKEGAYALPDDFGRSKSNDNATGGGGKYAPPPTAITEPIEWED